MARAFRHTRSFPATLLSITLWLVALMQGCATYAPREVTDVPFQERAQRQAAEGLSVTVAVPTRDEAAALYGVDLAKFDMQAVWVEVRNDRDEPYWLLKSGIDPAYFATSEGAYAFRHSVSADAWPRLSARFDELRFANPVRPGSTTSGFVLVNRDEGYKAVDIDLIGRSRVQSFTYIISDPEFRGTGRRIDFDTLYKNSDLVHVEEPAALRALLEELPCCTSNKDGKNEGDPLNLVIVGDSRDVWPAFIRRGWHAAEVTWSGAIWKTIRSFMSGARYRYAPISPLYVYGRAQDIGAQKARGTIHERNHMRIWLTPIRYRGEPVWIGQISRDIGIKFTTKSPTISTHVIDPDVDEARRYIQEDLAYSQALARIALVSGVGPTPVDAPRMNLVGDPWYSDGLRAVMFFEPRPRGLDDIEFLAWEVPKDLEALYEGDE